MKHYGIEVAEGSKITNAVISTGTTYPANADEGELFFRSDLNQLHVYDGTTWLNANKVGILSVSEDTSPQLGGDLDLNSFSITDSSTITFKIGANTACTIDGDGMTLIDTTAGTADFPRFKLVGSSPQVYFSENAVTDKDAVIVLENGLLRVDHYLDNGTVDGTVLSIDVTAPDGTLTIDSQGQLNLLNTLTVIGSNDQPQLVVKANTTQTTNLQEWYDSTSALVSYISNSGRYYGKSVNVEAPTPKVRFLETDATANNQVWLIKAVGETLQIQALDDAAAGGGNTFNFSRSGNQINSFYAANAGMAWFTIDNANKKITVNDVTNYTVTSDGDLTHKKYVDDKIGQDLGEYTLANLPTASSYPNYWALVTDAANGRTIVRSDGTNWKIVAVEGATVS